MKNRVKSHGIWFAIVLSGCTDLPDNITPVDQFQVERYLGKWYEIARLDHSFERGLTKVTAEYLPREDGGIDVINRGYSAAKEEWARADGKAYFVEGSNLGYLKVSFFGPFYGSYVVIALDHENYQYSLVSGPDRSYLWILARTPELDRNIQKELVERARSMGFDTSKLIFVSHSDRIKTPDQM